MNKVYRKNGSVVKLKKVMQKVYGMLWDCRKKQEGLCLEKQRIIFISSKIWFFAGGNTRSSQNWVQDYEKVLKKGLKGLREDAKQRLETLKEQPIQLAEKGAFLEACIVTCDAIAIWVQRYAKLAREMADREENAFRKAELLEIAEVCEWVPENPARTFIERLCSLIGLSICLHVSNNLLVLP